MQERYCDKFEAKALELVAKRVSAATGDMRTAINMCDTAVYRAARAARAAGKHAAPALITVSQAASALAECCSGASAQTQKQINAIKGLPGQQQLLLCTLAIARGNAIVPTAVEPQPSPLLTPKPLSSIFPARAPFGRSPVTPLQCRAAPSTPFGLAATPQTGKATNRAFPMADAEILPTPTSAPPTSKATPATPIAGKAAMSLPLVYSKYKAAAREAGFALVDMSQLKEMVGALQESGLLEAKSAVVQRGERMVSLAVGTADVKHALAESRMLQPLVALLP